MKTKILIIPVDLGFDISDIINTTLTELTSESKTELDKALNIAKAAKQVTEEKNRIKDEKTSKIQKQVETLYNELIKTSEGIATNDIRLLINDPQLNLSTLTSKLKSYIKSQDQNYELEKISRSGTNYYRITKLNQAS